MGLKTYRQKRRFDRTPEPRGVADRLKKTRLRFVVQKHDASRLHYDFRLEWGGVLKSWAVPKGPSLDPGRKSLAVAVEDHPVGYGDFEGVIPEGEYGGGTVMLWDTGIWEPLHDAAAGLVAGKLHFVLHGKKLKGEWSLVQMHGKAGDDGKNWLLMKIKDQHASTREDVLSNDKSVKTGRSLEEVSDQRDAIWTRDSTKTVAREGSTKSAWPKTFSPQLAVLAEAPPAGQRWVHEIKYDGYRFLARIKDGEVKLITRNGNDWTAKFPSMVKALSRLKVDSAIVDGELVVLDEQGRSDFQSLQALVKDKASAQPIYFAFDLPFCNGVDLRDTPLIERKKQLEEILRRSRLAPLVNFSQHIQGEGSAVVGKACEMGLEGIVSKRADSPYVSRRDPSWLKSKCGQRQEFVVIGYTDPRGTRAGFGALLLGYGDGKKKLVYAGRVGTGFDDRLLKQTLTKLKKLQQDDPPTAASVPTREQRDAHWVKPTLVVEVKFTGWTRDGVLRHPSFVAFRSDKPANQVVRERAVETEKIEKITRRVKSEHAPAEDVQLSHPDKVLYPDAKVTKQDLADYYAGVEQWMLPWVTQRPLALVRCPGGLAGKCFFQRNWSDTLPAAIDKVDIGRGKKHEFHVVIHDVNGVLSMAQMGVLEIHTWGCRVEDLEEPDQLIFDLDPGPEVSWKTVIKGALLLNATLLGLKLPTFLKTSGGKGLHITIPIASNVSWDEAKSFCKTIAESMVQKSDLFVANMRKDLRVGKIYIDYNRNGRSATTVAPYSTRARRGAPIAMPIAWSELARLKSADQFKLQTALAYLKKRKQDPWKDFEKSRVDLRKAIR